MLSWCTAACTWWKDALNDGKLIEAGPELDIVSRLLDQLDDMTSKSEQYVISFQILF